MLEEDFTYRPVETELDLLNWKGCQALASEHAYDYRIDKNLRVETVFTGMDMRTGDVDPGGPPIVWRSTVRVVDASDESKEILIYSDHCSGGKDDAFSMHVTTCKMIDTLLEANKDAILNL